MAITSKAFIESGTTLETNVNTYLASLATSIIIAGWSMDLFIVPKRLGTKIGLNLLLNTGGAVVATPWLIKFITASTAAELDTDMAAFLATVAAGYTSAPKIKYLSPENGEFDQFAALVLYNATAGASANYLPR